MQILFIVPGDINVPTGGYLYDRKIIEEWQKAYHSVELIQLDGDYPFPSDAEKQDALEKISMAGSCDIAVVDGLAGGAHPELMAKLADIVPTLALIHHPLCLETGLNEKEVIDLRQSEALGLKSVRAVVTTSVTTAKSVNQVFNFPSENVYSVEPGVERHAVSTGTAENIVRLLCVGSIIERKGHRDLLQALGRLKHLDWHLDCVGSTDLNAPYYDEVCSLVARLSLEDRVTFHGSVERETLQSLYERAHLFTLPSHYEGYGMAYAEAIVAGLPVIGTTGGAIPRTVPENCGILIEPGNLQELQNALNALINDSNLRQRFRTAAVNSRNLFPDWKGSASRFMTILQSTTKPGEVA